MAVCEIKVHSTDTTRIDLVIPGQQYFYLKAVNAAERQKWLVALGTAKACLTDGRTKKDKEFTESKDSLKTKMSELRLYCDLLMQQVFQIQEAVQPNSTEAAPNVKKIDEASSLLKETCNQFIGTLEDCMKIANSKVLPMLMQLSPPESPVSVVSPVPHNIRKTKRSMSHSGVVSPERLPVFNQHASPEKQGPTTVLRNIEEMAVFRASQHRKCSENETPKTILKDTACREAQQE
ncbi:pleckstrin homology domain-containing family A member 3-like isoform X2 [Protopterus annectens]|nr:pleckstrin homology domain-containing family A member 3-like isoform X2 [Protopterus annectens]XP_043939862.1 pleckstrin homology domain-containing family A member 3-like isoform X2 [Protopterus annectens]